MVYLSQKYNFDFVMAYKFVWFVSRLVPSRNTALHVPTQTIHVPWTEGSVAKGYNKRHVLRLKEGLSRVQERRTSK